MNPLILALLLIVLGLAVCWLSSNLRYPVLVTVAWWIGLLVALFGVILILTPILVWINGQLRAALGA